MVWSIELRSNKDFLCQVDRPQGTKKYLVGIRRGLDGLGLVHISPYLVEATMERGLSSHSLLLLSCGIRDSYWSETATMFKEELPYCCQTDGIYTVYV